MYTIGMLALFAVIFTNIFLIFTENVAKADSYVPPQFRQFNSYDDIIDYLFALMEKFPEKIIVKSIGTTTFGYDIVIVKVGFNQNTDKNPIILIDSGTHAREWMSVAVCLYLIHQLVAYSTNEHMLFNVDWYFLPLVNPDGYIYSMTTSRNWRKNMTPGRRCTGVDLNRNFGFHWGEDGASKNECSLIYAGRKPFSELETKYFKHTVTKYKKNIKLYVSLHTYGELITYPWGYVNESVSETFENEHNSLGQKVADAINSVRGSNYKTGRQSSILYVSSGISIDWMSAVAKIPLTYILEINNKDLKFHAPAKEIYPTGKEIFKGFKIFHRYVEDQWAPAEEEITKEIAARPVTNGRDTIDDYKRYEIVYKKKKRNNH